MSENMFSTDIDLRTEKAQRAVKVFRGMQPSLTGYARALTGRKDVVVELAQGVPRTDGTKIMYKPPIELGDPTPHERRLCEKRDPETLMMLCPACRTREKVLVAILHEISHIAEGTFEKVSDAAIMKAVERAMEVSGTKYGKMLKAQWDLIPDYKKQDYLNLGSLISPYLPILVNSLEDARVDEGMFRARKGTRVMFDAIMLDVFRNGVERDDGTVWRWSERPLNSQVLIGIFALAAGYKVEGWFAPEVEVALSDDTIKALCSQIDTIRSAEGTYELAFPILQRLRELGFCKAAEDPDDDEPESQEPEENPQDEENEEEDAEDGEDDSGSDRGSDEGAPQSGEGDQDCDPDPAREGASDSSGEDLDDEDGSDGSGGRTDASEDESGGRDAGLDEEGSTGEPDSGSSGCDSESEDESSSEDSAEEPSSGDGRSDGSDEGLDEGRDGDSAGDAESSESATESESDSSGSDEARESEYSDDGNSDGESSGGSAGGDQDNFESGLSGNSDDQPGLGDNASSARVGDATGEPGELTDAEDSESDSEGLESPEANEDDSGDPWDRGFDEESDEVIDSGADDGEGGIKSHDERYGTAENVKQDLEVFTGHEDLLVVETGPDAVADEQALNQAIVQGQYFERPSANVIGVREHKYGVPYIELDEFGNEHDMSSAWEDIWSEYLGTRRGVKTDLEIPESALGPALIQMRRTFEDNARAKHQRNLRSGKVNGRVLGKRAPFNDDRLFTKKRLPGKRSYSVLLGIDISGSTVGVNLALAKRMAMAQAELCNRMGIEFAIYAHTANGPASGQYFSGRDALNLDVYQIKGFDEPWSPREKEALEKISSSFENLDGHGVEYYRKIIERRNTTDKIILYYSDGKMPAANYYEELEILQREIAYCKKHQITLMGVGIRTDSPRRHGLNTVEVHHDEDIKAVVAHLESALLHAR